MNKIAPIVIFTYRRLNTLKKCIHSLKNNDLAKDSIVYFFSDGPKNKNQKKDVNKVRKYIKKITGFKKKNIFLRKNNFGLAKNIINGVSKVLKKESKVIVIEDDILVSKNFLNFMNLALSKYEKKKKVWHISGWNYNINLKISEDSYFTRGMNCWGWGTWKNRWKYFEKKPKKIIKTWKNKKIEEFNFEGSYNFFSQIIRNYNNSLNSWAIFWYASIFNKNKLCLNPKSSLTQNVGIGKKSTNTNSIEKIFNSKLKNNNNIKFQFPKKLIENVEVLDLIKKEFNRNKKISILKRIIPLLND